MKKIIFLHHSTGRTVWLGKTNPYLARFTERSDVKSYFNDYNRKNKTGYVISELNYPSHEYGWKNYPYDYYNIWVKNAGRNAYKGQPTLDMLAEKYDVIIFKHCFPVSKILEDTGSPDINSDEKRLENYKIQYKALKEKMHEFPQNRFIVWTPAVHVKNNLSEDEALRTKEFSNWIVESWDEEDDNIFIWDFYKYETEGDLYLKDDFAAGPNDSHPNKEFAASLSPVFSQFVIDIASGLNR